MSAQVPLETLDKDQIKTVSSLYKSKIIYKHNLTFISQFQEFLISYNKLSEICFNDCINDFTARSVKPDEVCSKYNFQIFLI